MRERLRDERGTTIAEMAVVILLLGLVSIVITSSISAATKTSATVQSKLASVSEARTSIEVIERDLRAANPIDAIAPELSVSQYATKGSTTTLLVGPSGPASLSATRQRGAVVNTASQPVFRYFDKDGNELATSGTSAPPSSRFRDCVRDVEVHVVVVTESKPSGTPPTADLITKGSLRNYNEVSGC
jgi:Flp pilus assembly pilin Flp